MSSLNADRAQPPTRVMRSRRYAVSLGVVLVIVGLLMTTPILRHIEPVADYCSGYGRAPDAEYDLQMVPTGEITLWPLGHRCEYETSDGEVLIVPENDWSTTAWVYGGLLVCAVGGALLLTSTRSRR